MPLPLEHTHVLGQEHKYHPAFQARCFPFPALLKKTYRLPAYLRLHHRDLCLVIDRRMSLFYLMRLVHNIIRSFDKSL